MQAANCCGLHAAVAASTEHLLTANRSELQCVCDESGVHKRAHRYLHQASMLQITWACLLHTLDKKHGPDYKAHVYNISCAVMLCLVRYGPCENGELQERMKRAVALLGREEVQNIMRDEGKIEVMMQVKVHAV